MTEASSICSAMSSCHLFLGLDEAEQARVAGSACLRHLQGGERLFAHGDEARSFYLLVSGQIKLTRLSPEGDEKVIEVIHPGQSFAEAVMFMEAGRYPVNAEALSDSAVIAFSSQGYKAILSESPDASFRLMATLSRHLHAHVDEIDRLTLSNAMTRLVAYLLQLQQAGETIDLAISKSVLASRLSIKPETLSRLFAKLKGDGLIAVAGNMITLKDIKALRDSVSLPGHD